MSMCFRASGRSCAANKAGCAAASSGSIERAQKWSPASLRFGKMRPISAAMASYAAATNSSEACRRSEQRTRRAPWTAAAPLAAGSAARAASSSWRYHDCMKCEGRDPTSSRKASSASAAPSRTAGPPACRIRCAHERFRE
eukprot:5818630-Pleurochrysis_carterae.AAC.1